MFYDENMPQIAAKPELKERRVKFTEKQLSKLDNLSEETGVPFSSLIRMAVNSFLPKTGNNNYTTVGIKSGYHSGGDR